MTLNELIAEVYTITKRADLSAETSLAVRKATMRLHCIDFFPKDLFEVAEPVTVDAPVFQLDLPERFRKWKYVRKVDLQGTPGNFLRLVSASNIFDEYEVLKENVYYNGGDVVNLRIDSQISALLLGYYRYPVVTVDAYASWIANSLWLGIVEFAAAEVFTLIGKLAEAKLYNSMGASSAALLVQSSLLESDGVN